MIDGKETLSVVQTLYFFVVFQCPKTCVWYTEEVHVPAGTRQLATLLKILQYLSHVHILCCNEAHVYLDLIWKLNLVSFY